MFLCQRIITYGVLLLSGFCVMVQASRYAVVVSTATYADLEWQAVVDTLLAKYSPEVELFTWDGSVNEVKGSLADYRPDYIGFIVRPEVEATEVFIRIVHQITRDLDADPYGDAIWGIITGYEAADALRAIQRELTIETTVGGFCTSNPYPPNPPHRPFKQAIGTFETEGGPHIRYSFSDGTVLDTMDPGHMNTDRTVTLANWLNAETLNIDLPGHPTIQGTFDMFVTSGHANVNEWQAHYPDPDAEGFFRSSSGQLRADTYDSGYIYINSQNPKVYFAPGNCLIGKPNNIHHMVYAWFHTGGATHMIGYMVVTWYGYQGWGTYSRFVRFPGLHNPAQAHYVTNQCLLFDQWNNTPGTDSSGLVHDRDAVALYGDPGANVKMFPFPDTCWHYAQRLQHISADPPAPDTFIFTVQANIDSVRPGTSNHPCYILPVRIDPATVQIETTDVHEAIITDNFVLLYCWYQGEPAFAKGETRFVRWTAQPLGSEERSVQHVVSQKSHLNILSSNPFRERVALNYSLSHRDDVVISTYDISGRLVKNLVNGTYGPGTYEVFWDGKDSKGQSTGTGVYFVSLRTKNTVLTRKLIRMMK